MKVVILLIFLFQLFIITPVFAQNSASIPEEVIEKLARELAEFNKITIEFQQWFGKLTPEEQEEAKKIFIEEFIKFQKENPDLKIEFK